ncbi:hypothetical protein DPMN_150429 [Dreissena polymorpha]|uniref:Uncharacterized protein n=1 Tax=Dreissena polymorpha TaxID=45954 RepID=A0A9D4FDB5_DREPO|nr:hypothetical protein DPMN_150429 [Dreissena polymorpha]
MKKMPRGTAEIMDFCDKRIKLRREKYPSKESNRQVRKNMKVAKDEWIDAQRINADKEMITGSN